MIRKLKIKFTVINMSLIMLVLLTTFCIIYVNSASNLETQSITALKDIFESKHFDFHKPEIHNDENGKYGYLRTYVIEFHKSNNKFYTDGQLIDDTDETFINEIVNYVQNDNNEYGLISEYNFRYYTRSTPEGYKIVLLDKSYEDKNLSNLAISLAISAALAFCAFLIISIILSGIIVKPVEKSINQQKQLISDVSHELKTPITVISNNAEIILSHKNSLIQDNIKWVEYIKAETARMSDLVSMMLYLAKSDESNEGLILADNDISNTLFEVLLPFESVCFESGKTLNMNIEQDIHVKCNEASIKQLLYILLDNALKYSYEKSDINVTFSQNGDKAVLSVKNMCDPIPPESIPLIFDRFYRVDESRSRDKGGSGLGLSIAKRITENNNASISVTSGEDGTVFTCTFDRIKIKNIKNKGK